MEGMKTQLVFEKKEQRDAAVLVRMTQDQFDKLEKRAKQHGVSVPELVRALVRYELSERTT